MLGNENVHLYNSDSDGGQIIRRRSTTRDSLPAVYLRNRNEICESMGPYASSRDLVGRRALSGAYMEQQGFFLDESKDMRECEDPSLGRFRRVGDPSHPDSIIVLMDDLPHLGQREVWSPGSLYQLGSPVVSPTSGHPKDFDADDKLSHKSSLVSCPRLTCSAHTAQSVRRRLQRSGNHTNPNRTMLERVDEQALSCSVIDVHQTTLPDLK